MKHLYYVKPCKKKHWETRSIYFPSLSVTLSFSKCTNLHFGIILLSYVSFPAPLKESEQEYNQLQIQFVKYKSLNYLYKLKTKYLCKYKNAYP